MLLLAVFAGIWAIPSDVAAQEATPPAEKPVLTIPAPDPIRRNNLRRNASVERVKTVDIEQWAKDKGHNGTAVHIATVAPDGTLLDLKLSRSSNSPAIDAAAKARAEQLRYTAARNYKGEAVQGTIAVYLGYARYDEDSPGGGFDDYTCGDMLREYKWFSENSAGYRKVFWPKNAFILLPSMAKFVGGGTKTFEERETMREDRRKEWKKLTKRCAKSPKRLFLDEVDDREFYLTVAEGF